ncbi:MAG: aminotransferase class I/II-fold pyridoxal phosphate-dependent enzyme [Oscillospiraceae bacterium]
MYHFKNDYSEGAHPAVLAAVAATNLEGNIGYGLDPHCEHATAMIRKLCKTPKADVQFLMGGTQTNLVAVCAFLRPWEGIICCDTGHLNDHEGGAVEATGHKLILVPNQDGKLTPDSIESILAPFEHPHTVRPRLVYVSDATESGTVYTKAELTAISKCCKKHGFLLFLDGARLGAALASSVNDMTLADIAALTDAFYIGGTKNGALLGEALVIVNTNLQEDFIRLKKQRGAVMAKGWVLGAEYEALFTDDLYFKIGAHEDEMAQRLQNGLLAMGYTFMTNSPTNQIFPIVAKTMQPKLDKICWCEEWCPWDDTHVVVRFVTSFATTEQDVDGLLSELKKL